MLGLDPADVRERYEQRIKENDRHSHG